DARLKWEGLAGGTHATRAKFYTEPGCKSSYKNYVQHFVERTNYYTGISYKEDPTVFAWELMNEPRYQDAGENSTGITLRKWTDEMGAFIKDMDPNHMLALGIEGHESKYGFGGDEGNPFIYTQQSPYIDFCTAHPYPDESWANLSVAQTGTLVEKWINDAHNVVGKPFVLEEFNTHNNKADYWNIMFSKIESMNAAGDNFWNYNDISTSNFDMLYGDSILSTIFVPHAEKMAGKNTDPVHKPLDFKQTYPANGATGVMPSAAFKWDPSVGAKSYTITVSEDASFSNPVINATEITGTSYAPSTDLKFNTKYYWKVTALNVLGDTVAQNSGISFTTRPAATVKPGAFNLISPDNNFVGAGIRPEFKWSLATEGLSYSIVVSKNSDLSSPVINVNRLTGSSYIPDKDLELGVKYYWKVTAVNNIGSTSPTNGVFSFTTIDLPPVISTAKVSAALNGSYGQESQYKIIVQNNGPMALDKFSVRVYVDLSEIIKAGYKTTDVTIEKLYDQTSGKTTFSGPFAWDAANNIYYFQVNWNTYSLDAGATIEQDIRLRLSDWGKDWDATNDYSNKGLSSSFSDAQNMPLYRGNLRMFGADPGNGSVTPTPTPTNSSKLSGYIAPDFAAASASNLKAGFNVEVTGSSINAKTDENGYFELTNLPAGDISISIKISKPGFLDREINGLVVNGGLAISTPSSPIEMWAGDIPKNGVADGAINMADIIEMAKVFNKVSSDPSYVLSYDINMDGAINMSDIIIIAKHFGAISSSYPAIN
ncbi:MAG: cellulase family glycosylhydrolase, partial [Bacillota bacterium]|nr:cellulase family glycosylhydrolase [Bacillota bacterium]